MGTMLEHGSICPIISGKIFISNLLLTTHIYPHCPEKYYKKFQTPEK